MLMWTINSKGGSSDQVVVPGGLWPNSLCWNVVYKTYANQRENFYIAIQD